MSSPDFNRGKKVGRNSKKSITQTDVLSLTSDKNTQTSKTILQLAALELEKINNPQMKETENKEEKTSNTEDNMQINKNLNSFYMEKFNSLVLGDEEEASNKTSKLPRKEVKVETSFSADEANKEKLLSASNWSRFTIKEIRVKSFDSPSKTSKSLSLTNTPEIPLNENFFMNSITGATRSRRGKSLSPPQTQRHSIICVENSLEDHLSVKSSESSRCKDLLHMLLVQVKSPDWDTSLKALVEIANHSDTFDFNRIYSHMTEINQRLIEFLRSPRSYVCRTSCQIAGKLFETIKDTRRPEFDEIVELLLAKTADANKFLRKDANVALDSLAMYISPFHTIRAISAKGPGHKNDLVRISSARLFVCIIGIAGANLILSQSGNEFTRKRVLTYMVKFIKDKNLKTREYGIRLYTLLHNHANFEFYLKKVVDKSSITDMRKILKEKI